MTRNYISVQVKIGSTKENPISTLISKENKGIHLFYFLIYLCIHILNNSCLFKAANIDFTKHLHTSMQIMSQLASESYLSHQNIQEDHPKIRNNIN